MTNFFEDIRENAIKFKELYEEDVEEIKKVENKIVENLDKITSKVLSRTIKLDFIKECMEKSSLSEEKIYDLLNEFFKVVFRSEPNLDYVKYVTKVGLAHLKNDIGRREVLTIFSQFANEIVSFLASEGEVKSIPAVLRRLLWTYHIMDEAYREATYLCLKKVNISKELFRRVRSLKADEIYNELINH